MKTTTSLKLVLSAIVIFLIQSCQKDPVSSSNFNTSNFESTLARDWFTLQRRLIKETSGFTPPVAARSLGYAGVTFYQSVYQGMPGYQTLEGKINGLAEKTITKVDSEKSYHWALVANAAMAEYYRNLFKTASLANLQRIDSVETAYIFKYKNDLDQTELNQSVAYGKLVGSQMYEYSKTDGQDEAYKTNFPAYVPATGPGKWVPTGSNATPLQPYWGSVRPFLTTNITLSQPPPPPSYSTAPGSKFYTEATEVYNTWKNLSTSQKEIAQYWSDDPGKTSTPAGHTMYIATLVLEAERADLAKAAEVFCKTGIALHDAFISCWKCKYDHNLIRPVSYIQQVIDPNFQTILVTPPFPEYTSGHSVQSAAGMTVLTEIFGNNYAFADFSNYGRTDINGSPRSYGSFLEAADQAAISRLYGGIHFRSSIENGVDQGKKIGSNTVKLKLK